MGSQYLAFGELGWALNTFLTKKKTQGKTLIPSMESAVDDHLGRKSPNLEKIDVQEPQMGGSEDEGANLRSWALGPEGRQGA